MNEWYAVLVDGVEWRCRLRGSLRKPGREATLPVIGDTVTVTPTADGTGIVEAVGERRSVFSRRSAGRKGAWREQILAANVDQVLVVFAAANPEPHLRAVDRYLVIAEASELPAHLVVNKVDLTGEAAAREMFAVYERAGYPVRYASAAGGTGLDGLLAELTCKTTLVAGPSGTGKSSLLNAVVPGLELRTGEVSHALRKGKHTTVVGELHPLPGGGFVADTPGLRELAPWGLEPFDLSECFPEMRPFHDLCQWSGCLHQNEGGCAVRGAVERDAVSAARYDSYLRLLEATLAEEQRELRAGRRRER